jgi:hypothetical protein
MIRINLKKVTETLVKKVLPDVGKIIHNWNVLKSSVIPEHQGSWTLIYKEGCFA